MHCILIFMLVTLSFRSDSSRRSLTVAEQVIPGRFVPDTFFLALGAGGTDHIVRAEGNYLRHRWCPDRFPIVHDSLLSQ